MFQMIRTNGFCNVVLPSSADPYASSKIFPKTLFKSRSSNLLQSTTFTSKSVLSFFFIISIPDLSYFQILTSFQLLNFESTAHMIGMSQIFELWLTLYFPFKMACPFGSSHSALRQLFQASQTELFIPSPQPIKITFELVFSLHPFMITKLLKQLMLIYTIEHSSKVHIASAFLAN